MAALRFRCHIALRPAIAHARGSLRCACLAGMRLGALAFRSYCACCLASDVSPRRPARLRALMALSGASGAMWRSGCLAAQRAAHVRGRSCVCSRVRV